MARINLLPWRAERRRQRQKEFQLMLGAAAVGGLLLSGLIYMYNSAQISGQNDRNTYMQNQIAEIDKQIAEIKDLDAKKADLLNRKQAIEQLQANRYQMVHLFDAIARTLPDGLVLTSLKQEGETLTLQGRAQSNARVATYMRNLEGSGWMTKPEVNVIEVGAPVAAPAGAPAGAATTSTVLPYVFTLKVTLANPNAPKDPNAPPTPDPVVTPMPQPVVQAAPVTAPAQPAPATTTPPPTTTPAPAATAPTSTPAAPVPANQGK